MAKHVMADIETLSTQDNAVIVSIGGVLFDQDNILDKFHVGIDPASAQNYGLHLDAKTVMYWLDPKQDAARIQLIALPKVDLFAALDGFSMWVQQTPVDQRGSLWGKGSTFDNVIIKNAFKAIGEPYPFTYRQDECYRTLANRCPDVKYEQVGTAHDALDDAESQALHLQAICKQYGIML